MRSAKYTASHAVTLLNDKDDFFHFHIKANSIMPLCDRIISLARWLFISGYLLLAGFKDVFCYNFMVKLFLSTYDLWRNKANVYLS